MIPNLDPHTEYLELAAIEGESLGWMPLGDRAYLHVGNPDVEGAVITVTGIPDASMAGMNVLLLY